MHLISWASQLHCFGRPPGSRFVNLDPAAESFDYPVAMDIRELICLDDVMEDLGLGPNGGLIYCMEHLEENLDDWVADELENYLDDDYLVFDCPANNPCTGIHWNYFNSSMVLIVSLQPCIIFMDEIDAIGGRCFSEGTSVDREIQRILMELLNQLDGFDQLGKVSFGLFRDNVTRLYAFWGTDDGGCFNLLCSGFIQTGQAVTLGAATRVSTYGGEQIVIRVKIYWV